MASQFTGEFLGTMVLILLGNGVVAGVLLKQSKGEGAGWVAITVGWALAVMCGIFTSMACGGPGSLNPAGVIAGAVKSGDYSTVATLCSAQMLGAIAGAILVWLFYLPHWSITEDQVVKRSCYCNTPAIRHTGSNLFCEVVATFALILVASAVGSKAVAASGAATGMTPWFVGMIVWSVGISLGGTTGYAINPARDLGPRIAHAFLPIAGKGDSDWGYSWIPVVGPILGGIAAGLLTGALGF